MATSARVSDYTLFTSATFKKLRDAMLKKPEAKKLAKELGVARQISQLPNVKIASKRVTPIHKEKTVGRWKLIQRQLQDRGLPVTGYTIPHKTTLAGLAVTAFTKSNKKKLAR